MSNSVVGRFLKSIFWSASEQIVFMVLSIVQLSIISRLLSPLDFGIYAIAMFFSTLGSTAFSMGLGPALIQKRGDISSYYNMTWTISFVVALVASVILGILSPFICIYYFNSPESVGPSIVMLVTIVFNATTNPKIVFFIKELNFQKQFYLRVLPRLLSFIMVIICAYILNSYWGLIIAVSFESVFRFFYSYIILPYRPKFDFEKGKFKELYSFGGWLQLKNIVNWLVSNVDVAIVGNVLGTVKLGFFNRAQSISSIPKTLVNSIVDTVAFPLYSQLQDDDLAFSKAANTILDLSQCIVSYVIVMIVLFGGNVIELVLGKQWMDLTVPFVILVIAYACQSLLFSFNPIIRARGLTKYEFWFYIIKFGVMVVALYPMAKLYGLVGVSFAILLAVFIGTPVMLVIIRKKTSLKLRHFVKSFFFSLLIILLTILIGELILPKTSNLVWMAYALGMSFIFLFLLVVFAFFKIGYGANIKYLLRVYSR